MSTAIYISPLAYLRSMIAIAWSAFRHPFTNTVVDLLSGKYVEQEEESHSEAMSKAGDVQERHHGMGVRGHDRSDAETNP